MSDFRARGASLLILLMLAACNGRSGQAVRVGEPGLDIADVAMAGGSPQIALQATDQILAKKPNDTAALVVRGDALTALGRFDEAAEDYSRVLQANSDSVSASIGLGRIRLASDPAAAEALFLATLRHDPRNTIAMTDLGIARDLQGRHADAQEAYRAALGLNPELHAAQVNLALSMAMSGQGGEAVKMIRPLAMAPSASKKIKQDYAAVLALSGDRPSAERILSNDLSPVETRQVLDAYAARAAAPAPSSATLADTAPADGPVAPHTTVDPVRAAAVAAPVRSPTQAATPAIASETPTPEADTAVAALRSDRPASEAVQGPAVVASVQPPSSGTAVSPVATTVTAPEASASAVQVAVQRPGAAEAPVTAPLAAPLADAPPAPPAATSVAPQSQLPAAAPAEVASVAAPPATAVTAPDAAPSSDPAARRIVVQLSAAMSEDAANTTWQMLQDKLPAAMNGRSPTVTRVERDGHVFWRLRTGGFATASDARAFCDQIRGAGGACMLIGV